METEGTCGARTRSTTSRARFGFKKETVRSPLKEKRDSDINADLGRAAVKGDVTTKKRLSDQHGDGTPAKRIELEGKKASALTPTGHGGRTCEDADNKAATASHTPALGVSTGKKSRRKSIKLRMSFGSGLKQGRPRAVRALSPMRGGSGGSGLDGSRGSSAGAAAGGGPAPGGASAGGDNGTLTAAEAELLGFEVSTCVPQLAERTFPAAFEAELAAVMKIRNSVKNKFDYKKKSEEYLRVIKLQKKALADLDRARVQFVDVAAAVEAGAADKAHAALALARRLRGERDGLQGEAAEWRAAAQAQEARAETLAGQLAQAEDEAARAREHADREAGALAAAREAGAARALELGELGLRAERLEEDLAKAQARLEVAAAAHAAETAELGAAHAEEAADLRARLAEQTQRAESAEEELAAVAGVRDELQAKSADLGAQVLRLESDNRQNAAAAAHKEEVAGGLRADLAAARRQLEDKGKEYQLLLAGLATAQQAAAEREEELRAGRRAAEERALAAEAGRAAAAAEAGRLRAEGAARGAELAALREAAAALQARAEGAEARAGAAEGAARASAAALAVEGELRARAEAREGEERSERAAATAQLLAQEQGHRAELDRVGGAARARAAEDARQLAAQRDRAEALANEVAEEKTAAAGLAAEIESLKTALAEAAQSTAASAEHLAEVALLRGELERARRRGDEMASLREADRGAQANRAEEAEAKAAALERERRRLHNLVQELRGNVRVLVRVRPFLPGDGRAEAEGAGAGNRWGVARCHPDGARLSLEHEVTRTGREGERSVGEAQAFAFDKVLAPSVGQEGVFAEVSDLVQSALDGFDVCIFAYGQTGSGKTHTMQGARQGPLQGVIPRAVAQLGAAKARLEEEGWAFRMEATFLEIYNEQVRDLLVLPAEARERKYEVKLGKDGQPHVAGLEHAPIDPTDAEAIEQLMETANRNRSIAKTDMNEHSSRSHSVFTLHIHASNERMGADFDGKLHLVDLAGSERVDRSNAKGQQLKEAQAINSSLASLADVFHALGNRQAHVPFRNSKLTHLLQPALSGDGKTLMIVNCAPTAASYQETLCSLRFASKVNKCELGRPKKHLRQHRRSIVDSSKVGGNAKRKASGQSS